ncbi:hypothetical protein ACLMJK_009133 [Lecanora helva]
MASHNLKKDSPLDPAGTPTSRRFSRSRFPHGNVSIPVTNDAHSHIQIAPAPRESSSQDEKQEEPVPVFQRLSYSSDVEGMRLSANLWKVQQERFLSNLKQDEVNAAVPPSLGASKDGTTFAAKARQAELNAARNKQAQLAAAKRKEADEEQQKLLQIEEEREADLASKSQATLSKYVILKRKHQRKGSSKTLRLPEIPPKVVDENKQQISSPTHSAQPSDSQHQPTSTAGLDEQPGQSLTADKGIISQTRTSEPHSPVLPPADPLTFSSLSKLAASTSTPSQAEQKAKQVPITDSTLSESTTMPRGRKGLTFATPVTPTSSSHQQAYGSNSGNRQRSDVFRDNPATGPVSRVSSLNPTHQPFLPRAMMGENITPTHFGADRSYPGMQRQSMDDPFSVPRDDQHGREMAFARENPYLHSSHGIYGSASGYANENEPPRHSIYGQQAYAQQSSQPQASSFTQHPLQERRSAYNMSFPATSAFTRENAYEDEDPFYQQQGSIGRSSNYARAAPSMPPSAVRGTPTSDPRLRMLHSVLDEQQLQVFYASDHEVQQEFLNHHFGPLQQSRNLYGSDPHLQQNCSSAINPQQAMMSSQFSDNTPGKFPPGLVAHAHARQGSQPYPTSFPHAAPNTRFDPGDNKRDKMLQNLGEAIEISKAHGDLSGTPRTVLHDPLAHTPKKTISADASSATPNPMNTNIQQTHTQAEPSTASGSTQSTVRPPSAAKQANVSQVETKLPSIENLVLTTQPQDKATPAANEQGPTMSGSTRKDKKKSKKKNKKATVDKTGGLRLPSGEPVKYTATEHPIPHGGFADFTTPYNVTFFDKPEDYHPGKNFSPENPVNVAVHEMAAKSMEGDRLPNMSQDGLAGAAEWFHSAQRFSAVNRMAKEMDAREAASRPQPAPIGHERASGQLSAATTVPSRDIMTNPTAQDAKDVFAGMLANLKGYADGSEVGDYFTRWGAPPDWAIDKSKDGNKSFFGGGFDAAPQRVARDPRYQQTRTSDGRPTYFEDPAGGRRGRQWGMP